MPASVASLGTVPAGSMWAGGEPFVMADLLHAPDWHAGAACRSRPDLSWFPATGDPVDEIRALCQSCPVLGRCRQWPRAGSDA